MTKRQKAKEAGYTKLIGCEGGGCDLDLLVKPEAHLDGTFRAFCLIENQFIRVNGSTCYIQDLRPSQEGGRSSYLHRSNHGVE